MASGIQENGQRNTERQPMGYRKTTNGILKNAQWETEKDEEPMRYWSGKPSAGTGGKRREEIE